MLDDYREYFISLQIEICPQLCPQLYPQLLKIYPHTYFSWIGEYHFGGKVFENLPPNVKLDVFSSSNKSNKICDRINDIFV